MQSKRSAGTEGLVLVGSRPNTNMKRWCTGIGTLNIITLHAFSSSNAILNYNVQLGRGEIGARKGTGKTQLGFLKLKRVAVVGY
jgi:hypothetical protein